MKTKILTGHVIKALFVVVFLMNFTVLEAKSKKGKTQIGVLINVIDHDYEKITDEQLKKISSIGYQTIELGAYTKPLSPRFMTTYTDLKFKTMASGSNLYDLKTNTDELIRKALKLKQEYLICYWPWLDGAEHLTLKQCQ